MWYPGMKEGDKIDREMEKEQDPRKGRCWVGERLEVDLGRQEPALDKKNSSSTAKSPPRWMRKEEEN